MKKLLLIGIGLLISALIVAQVAVNPQLPPSGLRIKSQLWNLSLVNTTNGSLNVKVEMTMTDLSNNQRILSAVTNSFLLPRGMKQMQASNMMPINYNLVSAGYNVDASQDGFLPIGVFNICYTVINMNNDAHGGVAEACEAIEIEPVSPPQLVVPVDSEYVTMERPVFNWLPPTPAMLFTSLIYDWTLTEVYPGQTATEALQQNIPVLKQQNVRGNHLQYPISSPPLEKEKLYAWGVVAKNNSTPVGNSDVWTFRLQTKNTPTVNKAEYYVRLKREEDASFVVCDGLLRFEYFNEVNDSNVQVNVFDITKSRHESIKIPNANQVVRFGQNYLQMNLKTNQFKQEHIYLLELINARKEKWYLKFEYRKQD